MYMWHKAPADLIMVVERGQVADRGPTWQRLTNVLRPEGEQARGPAVLLSQRVALLQQRLGIRRDVVTTRAPYQLCRVVFDHA